MHGETRYPIEFFGDGSWLIQLCSCQKYVPLLLRQEIPLVGDYYVSYLGQVDIAR